MRCFQIIKKICAVIKNKPAIKPGSKQNLILLILFFTVDPFYLIGAANTSKGGLKPEPVGAVNIGGRINAYSGNHQSVAPRLNKKNYSCTIKADSKNGVSALIQATEPMKDGSYRLLVQIDDDNVGCPKGTNVWIYYGKSTERYIEIKGDQRKDKPNDTNAATIQISPDTDKMSKDDKITHATQAKLAPSGDVRAEIVEPDSETNLQPSVDQIAEQFHEKENPSKGFDSKASEDKKVIVSSPQELIENAQIQIQGGQTKQFCTDCNQHVPPQAPWHERCTTENDYLEGRIPSVVDLLNAASASVTSPTNDPNLAPSVDENFRHCVYLSMTSFPRAPAVKYGACNDKNSKIKDFSRIQTRDTKKNPIQRACASQNNVGSVTAAFEVASRCLGVDKNEVFALINHESGFNSNAVSATSCAGFGQLCGGTSNAIAEINQTSFDDMLSKLKSGKPECQALAKRMTDTKGVTEKMSYNPAASCERIGKTDKAGNWIYDPTRNVVYTLAYYLNNKSNTAKTLNSIPKFRDIKDPLVKNDILTTIAFLQHNAGPGSTKAMAVTFLKSYPKSFSNFEEFYTAFTNYINKHPSKNWVQRKEAQAYLGKIRKDLEKIDKITNSELTSSADPANSNQKKMSCSSWPSS